MSLLGKRKIELTDFADESDYKRQKNNDSYVFGDKFEKELTINHATRQIKEEDTMKTKGVFVTGMSRRDFNGLWERVECGNDGKPAFYKKSSFDFKNFIYFRKKENAWVIDDVINPTGPVYSRCQTNIDGIWSTTPEWCENPNIKVEKITMKKVIMVKLFLFLDVKMVVHYQ